jgi:thiol-disulfide isomerase/thioredoxin
LAVLLLLAQGLKLGEQLPPFDLPGVDGKRHAQSEYAAAKVLVVVFTCNHCPTAQAYEARLARLEADFRGKGVQVVAISPNDAEAVRLDELGYSDLDDTLEAMKIRARDRGFTFPYLYDGETQAFSRAVGVAATPQVFIFDAQRRLRYAGAIDDREVGEPTSHDARNAIEDLLAGRDVKVPQTRAFGCSTKWAEKRGGVAEADRAWAARPVSLGTIDAKAARRLVRNETEKFLLVNVWATWCGPCVAEFPELVKMQRMYGARPFRLATISLDPPDEKAAVEKFLKERQAAGMENFVYESEDRNALADALDPDWEGPVPHTLLIAPGGRVVFRKTGELEPLEVRRAIVDRIGRTYAKREAPKETDLLVHLKFDEREGALAADASGYGQAGTAAGGPRWVEGRIGGALEFDGKDDVVELPDTPSLRDVQEGSYTVAAWFKPANLPPGTQDGANDETYGIVNKTGWHLGLAYNHEGIFTMHHFLAGEKPDGGRWAGAPLWQEKVEPGRWVHVAGVVDRAAGRTRIYLDGEMRSEGEPFAPTAAARAYGNETWKIGNAGPGAQTYGWPAKGAIDDVRIYKKALGGEEVRALYKSAP